MASRKFWYNVNFDTLALIEQQKYIAVTQCAECCGIFILGGLGGVQIIP